MSHLDNESVDEAFTGRSLLLLDKSTTEADFETLRQALAPLVEPGSPFLGDTRINQDLLWRHSLRYQIAVVPVSPAKLSLRKHAELGILAIVPERYLSVPANVVETDGFPEVPDEPYRRLGVRDAVATGDGIRVALIDSGVAAHPDLDGRIVDRKPFVPNTGVVLSHGTLCAGILCGPRVYQGKNGFGVAPRVSLFDAQVMADVNSVADDTLLQAIEWADAEKNVHIIVLAASAKTRSSPNPVFEDVGRQLIERLPPLRNILLIAAAGRAGGGAGTSRVEHPANCQSIVAINSVDDSLQPMTSSVGFRPGGDFVDFAAVGDALPSTSLPQHGVPGYGTVSGTSAATAFAGGIAALWAETTSAMGPVLWQVLLDRGVHVPQRSRFHIIGSGILKAPGSKLP